MFCDSINKRYIKRLKRRSQAEAEARWAAVGGVEKAWLQALVELLGLPNANVYPSDRLSHLLSGEWELVSLALSLLVSVGLFTLDEEHIMNLRVRHLLAKQEDPLQLQALSVYMWRCGQESALPRLREQLAALLSDVLLHPAAAAEAGLPPAQYLQGNAYLNLGEMQRALCCYHAAALQAFAPAAEALELIYRCGDRTLRRCIKELCADLPSLRLRRSLADILRM